MTPEYSSTNCTANSAKDCNFFYNNKIVISNFLPCARKNINDRMMCIAYLNISLLICGDEVTPQGWQLLSCFVITEMNRKLAVYSKLCSFINIDIWIPPRILKGWAIPCVDLGCVSHIITITVLALLGRVLSVEVEDVTPKNELFKNIFTLLNPKIFFKRSIYAVRWNL